MHVKNRDKRTIEYRISKLFNEISDTIIPFKAYPMKKGICIYHPILINIGDDWVPRNAMWELRVDIKKNGRVWVAILQNSNNIVISVRNNRTDLIHDIIITARDKYKAYCNAL